MSIQRENIRKITKNLKNNTLHSILRAQMFIPILLLTFVQSTFAWGNDGHQIIATIAQARLTSTANSKITKLLKGANMSSVATWADSVRKTPEWEWSAPLHFINVPDGDCTFSYTRDCKKDFCCAGAILNFTKQITESSQDAAFVAAKFVIHFVGDIHQPLHTAWHGDRGGNDDTVTLGKWDDYCSNYPPVNLHSVWDTCMINAYQNKFGRPYQTQWIKYAQELNGKITKAQAAKWGKGWTGKTSVDTWANEGVGYACSSAYKNTDGKYIDANGAISDNALEEDYYTSRLKIVDLRLSQAGVRLATLLNKILE